MNKLSKYLLSGFTLINLCNYHLNAQDENNIYSSYRSEMKSVNLTLSTDSIPEFLVYYFNELRDSNEMQERQIKLDCNYEKSSSYIRGRIKINNELTFSKGKMYELKSKDKKLKFYKNSDNLIYQIYSSSYATENDSMIQSSETRSEELKPDQTANKEFEKLLSFYDYVVNRIEQIYNKKR